MTPSLRLAAGPPLSYRDSWSAWPWQINFNLDLVPDSGDAILTLAFAGTKSARMDVYVNDGTNPLTRFYPEVSGGNALVREGIHAKYGVHYVSIPVSMFRPGANSITLLQGRYTGFFDHVMYDYLSLEMP